MAAASEDRIWVAAWRTSAFLVFAGMLAIVARSPRSAPGLWKLVIGQKLFLVVWRTTDSAGCPAHPGFSAPSSWDHPTTGPTDTAQPQPTRRTQ